MSDHSILAGQTLPPADLPPDMEPITKRGLSDEVVERIRQMIFQGELSPGQRLREEHLAEAFRISRAPVREAILRLEQEGLVVVRRNQGSTVARLDIKDAIEVFSLRLTLEGLAIQWAIRKGLETEIADIGKIVEQMRQAHNLDSLSRSEASRLDIALHDLLYKASHHQRLWRSWTSLRSQIHVLILQANVGNPHFQRRTVETHEALLEALLQRSEELGIKAVREHLIEGFQNYMLTYPAERRTNVDVWSLLAGTPHQLN